MQTFLAYTDFKKSAEVLDGKRLNKQKIEVLSILKSLYCQDKDKKGWKNHPAVKMWKNHENALVEYGLIICDEWIKRGYKDTCRDKISAYYNNDKPVVKPNWLNNRFCLSHQSNLIRKKPEHYRIIFGNDIPDNLPYVWPAQ